MLEKTGFQNLAVLENQRKQHESSDQWMLTKTLCSTKMLFLKKSNKGCCKKRQNDWLKHKY